MFYIGVNHTFKGPSSSPKRFELKTWEFDEWYHWSSQSSQPNKQPHDENQLAQKWDGLRVTYRMFFSGFPFSNESFGGFDGPLALNFSQWWSASVAFGIKSVEFSLVLTRVPIVKPHASPSPVVQPLHVNLLDIRG
jgi:hypothetical protein